MKPEIPVSPATILVVDDEPRAQILLRNLLEVAGYRVICASNGPEALASARQLPDVVLLDLMMPGMDGYEVCRRLRADPALAAMPVIMLTALDDRASRLKGLEAGADDFLSKPFDSAELRARLRTITRLNRYRSLYEERARFESAIAHAPEGIVLTELNGTIIHRNAAFERLLSSDGLPLSSFYACLPPEVAMALSAETGRPSTPREVTLLYGRTPETVVEITHNLIPWEGRGIIMFQLRDLTEKKQLEAQLLLSQRIEVLGQLAGSVVHDMNNVLTAIGGCATLLELDAGSDPTQHLRNIQTSVTRGAGLLRQLLMFARGSEGEIASINPASPVCEVVDLVRETFGRAYEVNFSASPGLPNIPLDPSQLHQVVMNLCVNARDAMPAGGRLEIAVGLRHLDELAAATHGSNARPGEYVAITVRDHGTGMAPEVLARLFEPFFTTKPRGKGTGLGLATVHRVVNRHGGFVAVDSVLGSGTSFSCHFPVPAGQTNRLAVA